MCMAKIKVKESEVTILCINENDYISLTDIAKHKSDDSFLVINHWMRNRNTIEYLGMWETIFNPDFKPTEFDRFKMDNLNWSYRYSNPCRTLWRDLCP